MPDSVGPVLARTGSVAKDRVDRLRRVDRRPSRLRTRQRHAHRAAGRRYGRIDLRAYRTKDDLLQHAVDVLLATRFSDDIAADKHALTATDPGSSDREHRRRISQPTPARMAPLQDRGAARLAPPAEARPRTMDHIQEAAIGEYLDVLGAKTAEERRALDMVARFAQVLPLGLAFVDLIDSGIPAIDWRLVLCPLLSPPNPE